MLTRRETIGLMSGVTSGLMLAGAARAQTVDHPATASSAAKDGQTTIKHVDAGVLNIGYAESGSPDGWPVILLHGFPYDIHAYDEVAPLLAAKGARVIVPYLRGYGPTRYLSPTTLRSGQQAALGADGRAEDSPRLACRFRLGRASGLRGLGAVARAGQRTGDL
jgi:hypothetical protein